MNNLKFLCLWARDSCGRRHCVWLICWIFIGLPLVICWVLASVLSSLDFFCWCSFFRGAKWCLLWSVPRHNLHTLSVWQNTSRSLSCFWQSVFQALPRFAGRSPPVSCQTHQADFSECVTGNSPPLVCLFFLCCRLFLSIFFFWADFLSRSAISDKTVLTCSPGLLYLWDTGLFHEFPMLVWCSCCTLCPLGVVAVWMKASRRTEHRNWSV